MSEFSKLEKAIKNSNKAYNRRKVELDSLSKISKPVKKDMNDTLALTDAQSLDKPAQMKKKKRRRVQRSQERQ